MNAKKTEIVAILPVDAAAKRSRSTKKRALIFFPLSAERGKNLAQLGVLLFKRKNTKFT